NSPSGSRCKKLHKPDPVQPPYPARRVQSVASARAFDSLPLASEGWPADWSHLRGGYRTVATPDQEHRQPVGLPDSQSGRQNPHPRTGGYSGLPDRSIAPEERRSSHFAHPSVSEALGDRKSVV